MTTMEQAQCLFILTLLLLEDKQLDTPQREPLPACTGLIPEKGNPFRLCRSHRLLGEIYRSKGEIRMAIQHLKAALELASSSNRHGQLFWVHYSLTQLSIHEGRLDDANTHLERDKSHMINNAHNLPGFWGAAVTGQGLVHTVQAGRDEV